MIKLSDREIYQYFHRSYTAVDGLWFIKVEENLGFDKALDIDDEVWKVMPKIQARFLKSKLYKNKRDLKNERSLGALFECFTTKLKIEGFNFKTSITKNNPESFMVIIKECPWHNTMIKSSRAALSEKIGTRICSTEYRVWAEEFGENIQFELKDQICGGSKNCILEFYAKSLI